MNDAAQYLRAEVSIDDASLHVISAHVRLAQSEVGFVDCELTDEAGGPDPASVIGKKFVFEAARLDGSSPLHFVGIVAEATLVGEEGNEPTLMVRATPRLWRYSKRGGYRVFQEKSVPDIVKEVLSDIDQDWKLDESYEKRIFCVQHRETDLAFVERLLAEEGIAYVIEAHDGTDKVIFTDGDLGPIDGPSELAFADAFGFDLSRDVVKDLEQHCRVRPGKVTLRDYDFERPDLTLETRAEGDGQTELEVYLFPGRFRKEAVGDQYAKRIVESLRADRTVISGVTGTLCLLPGHRFSIANHPYAALNRELCVTSMDYRYRGSRWGRSVQSEEQGCRFTAVPADKKAFRPPRRERARVVPGFDTAVVTGPAGKEIFPDEHGRTKAQYHWDRDGKRDDKSSCFMRTTQLALGGSLMTPRIGWEVAVQHMEGDPDEPVITGRLYNTETPPPYALPANKTRTVIQTATTPGGGTVNEIRLDDKKGSEEMFMNASKGMNVSAGNNATESVGGNETRNIGANQNVGVTGSMECAVAGAQSVTIGGNQKVGASTFYVESMGGAHTHSIGGNRNITVGGDHRISVSGASTLDVGGMQIDLVAGSVTDSTLADFTDDIGAALIELTASDRSVAVGAARTENTGAAKLVLARGGRGVKIGGSLTHKIAGALVIKTKAELNENAKGDLADVAGGAQIIKATEVTFAAKSLLLVQCGGATMALTPGSIEIAGTNIKIDASCPEVAPMIKDN